MQSQAGEPGKPRRVESRVGHLQDALAGGGLVESRVSEVLPYDGRRLPAALVHRQFTVGQPIALRSARMRSTWAGVRGLVGRRNTGLEM